MIKKNKKLNKSIVSIFIVFVFIFPPFLVQANTDPANARNNAVNFLADGASEALSCAGSFAAGIAAGAVASLLTVPTTDAGNIAMNTQQMVKECIIDGTANTLKRAAIRAMIDTSLEWINSGFQGSPSYAANLERLMEDVGNQILSDVIYGAGLGGLCQGFELPVKFALNLELNIQKGNIFKPKCTIDDIQNNIERAVKDVENFYSWNNFLQITTNSRNNSPFGAFFQVSEDARRLYNATQKNKEDELRNNRGFMSIRKCDPEYLEQRKREGKPARYDPADPRADKNCPVTTPGTLLADSLSKTTGAEFDELITADEFDEILGALAGALIKKLTADGGVASFSKRNAGWVGFANNPELTATDPGLESQKKYYSEQFDVDTYNIALKILNARKNSILNAQKIYDKNLVCWTEKNTGQESGMTYYRRTGVEMGISQYQKLTEETVDNSLNNFGEDPHGKLLEQELNLVNRKINITEAEKEKIESAQELIAEVKDIGELNEIISSLNIRGANLAKEQSDRFRVEGVLDKMINGEVDRYSDRGRPIKRGGIGQASRYCSSFDMSRTDTGISVGGITFSSNSEPDVRNLDSSGDLRFKDSYDPENDIYQLELKKEEERYGLDPERVPGDNNDGDGSADDTPADTEILADYIPCQNSERVNCMGEFDTTVANLKNESITDGKIQVYTLSPNNRKSIRGIISINNQNIERIQVSLTDKYNDDIGGVNCSGRMYQNENRDWVYNTVNEGETLNDGCNLVKNKVYFLRITPDGNGNYSLETVGDGSDRIEGIVE